LKILHGPQNIGGMAGVLAKAQRQLGVDAYSYCWPTGSFQFPADYVVPARGRRGYAQDLARFFLKEGWRYDGFQLYFGTSFLGPGLWDLPVLRAGGKKIYFYFCGCDVRDSKLTIEQYRYSACAECWPMLCSPNRKEALLAAERYGDAVFVSTPDLLEFVPNSVLLPQPLDLETFGHLRDQVLCHLDDRSNDATIRIAHAPSNQAIKGTRHLLQAVEALGAEGLPIELVLVEGKSYSDAMRLCASADIVVDQLLIGAYGQYAVEMMALGKPVICYIREDLRSLYPPELPIVSATPADITEVLHTLIRDRDRWALIGKEGMHYVDRYHDSVSVARRALEHY